MIVDDGSREPVTEQMLADAALPSPFHLIRLSQNRGITEALNTGLRWIQAHTEARYVARLDCSDTCHPERFHLQVAFLDTHPDVGLLGTWCTFQTEDGSLAYPYTTPVEHEAIKKYMHLRNVFIHPTVMFRAELLKRIGVYPYDYSHAEDYALFWSMIQVMKSAILDQYLVTCVINAAGISMSNREAQLHSRISVVWKFGTHPALKVLNFIKMKLFLFVPQGWLLWWKGKQA